MSVAPTRRFHEEGVGARTGLRIGDVPRDADGNYNVDAFLEAAKRGLMIESDEDESLASTSASRDPTPEPAPTDWDQRVSHISELAVSSLGNVDETSRVSALRRDDSMWESSVEVSADRTFNLTELAGDVQPSPPSMRRIERRERERRSTMLPMPSMDDVSWLRHSTRSPLDDSLRDTTLRESTRSNIFAEDSGRGPGRSFLGHDSVDASLAPASSPLGRPPSLDGRAPSVDRSRSATPLAPLMEADMGYPDTYSDAGESEGGYSELMPEPPKKRGRGRPRKSEALHAAVAAGYPLPRGKPGRPPGRQMPPQKIVEQIHDPPSWQIENPEGLRRGKRHRIAPLDWWRGERALYGRAEANNESVPKVPFGLVAPVLKEVIRVPRAPGEGTFSGMRRFKPKPTMYIPQQGSQRMYSATPEIPVDRDTDPYGVVYDAEMEQDVDMRITCTAESLRPQPAFNRQFLYEKVFTIGDYMAAGKLVIEQGGEKQPKSSKDNNYVRRVPDPDLYRVRRRRRGDRAPHQVCHCRGRHVLRPKRYVAWLTQKIPMSSKTSRTRTRTCTLPRRGLSRRRSSR